MSTYQRTLYQDDRVLLLQSYSYRNLPPCSISFDCRELDNPWRIKMLRPLHGSKRDVLDFVRKSSKFAPLFQKAIAMLPTIEGNMVFYCVGGRHRSVAMVELVAEYALQHGWKEHKQTSEVAWNLLDRASKESCGLCFGDVDNSCARLSCNSCTVPQLCHGCSSFEKLAPHCPRCQPDEFIEVMTSSLKNAGVIGDIQHCTDGCDAPILYRGIFRISPAGEYCRATALKLALPEEVGFHECVSVMLPYCSRCIARATAKYGNHLFCEACLNKALVNCLFEDCQGRWTRKSHFPTRFALGIF